MLKPPLFLGRRSVSWKLRRHGDEKLTTGPQELQRVPHSAAAGVKSQRQ